MMDRIQTRLRFSSSLKEGAVVDLDEAQRHHLCRVLRLEDGASVEVIDGEGLRWLGRFQRQSPPAVQILGPHAGESADPQVRLEVWLPLLKGGRTDDLVRQLTELGVVRLVPFMSRRSVARLKGERADRQLARWRTIAEEATRQCGRADLPDIAGITGLPTEGPGVVLWEQGGAPATDVMGVVAADGHLRVLTGPEGGLEVSEVEGLESIGWRSASLGPRILRADTAVVACATLALHALKEGGY